MQALKEEALARGHTLTDAAYCDAGVLPLPDSGEAFIHLLPLSGGNRLILHGRLHGDQAGILSDRGWRLKNIQEDEDYIQKNALISAEGALFAAMQKTDMTLRDAKCAVVGYGRIGKELTRLLLSLNARVNVVARRESARLQAVWAGAHAYDIEHLPQALSGVQLLFNTVPSQVIDAQALGALSAKAVILDLASPPYGLDLNLAREMGFDATIESGIPSRYAPRSAARLLMTYLEAGDTHG